MKWCKITLTHNQLMTGHIEKIQKLFQQIEQLELQKKGMTLYSEAIKGDEKILYLNPSAHEVLSSSLSDYTIELCNEPDIELSRLAWF